MADLGGTFDANAVPEDEGGFDVIPAGRYDAQIIESEVVDTKSGTGKMLKLTWEITSGTYANRKVFDNVNIRNRSAKAEQIGQRHLADICQAAGVGTISDSAELHFKPCSIKVGIQKDKTGQYDDQNRVSRVRALGNAAAAPRSSPAASSGNAQASAPAQQAAQPASAGSRPWG